MCKNTNSSGQPIGIDLPNWNGAIPPNRSSMDGRYCSLIALDPAIHIAELVKAYSLEKDETLWTYIPDGDFYSKKELSEWLTKMSATEDPMFFAIIDNSTGKAVGMASFMRIDPAMGIIEVAYVVYSPVLKHTRMGTEAMYLMMARVFDDWGYRRYEWKCDTFNYPSREAAKRLGFKFEGIFRQALVYKNRNRDTAWHSIIDNEWPTIKARMQMWLSPNNFDNDGVQIRRLNDFT